MQPHAGEANFNDSKWQVTSYKTPRGSLTGAAAIILPVVSHDAEHPGQGRRLRRHRRQGGVHSLCGRLCGGVDQRPDAVAQRLSGRRHQRGPQHAEPRRLAETVKPGDKFQITVFGINGPISVAPSNFIFFRDAKVSFTGSQSHSAFRWIETGTALASLRDYSPSLRWRKLQHSIAR